MNSPTPSITPYRRAFLAALSAIGITLSDGTLHAADQTYDDTNVSNVWDLSTQNWDASTAIWTNGNNAIFGGTGESVAVNAALTVGNITFNSTGYTIAPGTGSLTLAAGTDTISVGTGFTDTISAALIGTGAVSKTGAGTLTLSGVNTFSGGLTISAGVVSVAANTALGGTSGTAGAVTLDGGTLRTTSGLTNTHAITIGSNGGTINNTASANLVFGTANTLLGSGTLTITGNGAYALAGSRAGVVPINASNTFSGNVILQDGGLLEYGNANALGSGATVTVNNNGTLSAQGVAVANAVTVNTGGVLAFQNNANGSFTGDITLAGSTIVRLQNWWSSAVQNGLISGKITGTGPLTINSGTGSGAVLTLNNAASDYTGTTTISGAVVNVGTLANVNTASSLGKGSAGGSSADLVLNNGTLRYTGATAQSTDRLFSVGTSGGTLDASGSNAANPLSFTGTGAMGFNSQTGARTLTLTGSNTGSNNLALAIGDNSGATSVTKTGAGTWALGGTNTYSGATTVTTGALSFLNTAAKSASTTVTAAAGTTVGLGVGGAGFYSSADVSSLIANTLSGFSLDVATSAGIDTTAGDFTFDTTGLSGTRGLSKLGSNTLIFSGTNTYAGATTVSSGTLEYQAAAAMSSSSALTMGSSGTLSLRADADTTFTPASITGSAGNYTIAVNQLTGAGAGKTITLANSLNMGSTGSNLTVSSTSGDTLLLSSQLALANSSASSNTINLSGANMTLNAGVNFNGATNGPVLNVNANSNTLLINGTWTTGNNRWSGIVVNNGTVTMANGQAGGSSTNNGVYAVLNGGTLNLNNANAIGGAVAGNNFTINGGTLDNTSGSTKTLAKNPSTTINGNFAFSTSGGTSANDLNLGTGTVSLGSAVGTSRTITTNGTATLTLGGIIANGTTATGIIKAGTGTLTLSGVNTYTGATTINGGTLKLGVANALSTATTVTLGGGTLNLGGFSQAAFTTALTMTSGSTIDFGTHVTALTLTFADSQAATWTGNLTLLNFTVGTDNLNFTSIAGGITTQQLGQITLAGYTATGFDGSGNVQFTASAVPEPATYAVLAGLGVLALATGRRRNRMAA